MVTPKDVSNGNLVALQDALPWAHRALLVGVEGRHSEDLREGFVLSGADVTFCSTPIEVRTTLGDQRFCVLVLEPLAKVFCSHDGEDLFDEFRRFDGTTIILNGGTVDLVLDAFRRKLHASGRFDHRECGRSRESAPDRPGSGVYASATAPAVSVLIDGLRMDKRNGFLIDGKRGSSPDSRFIALLKLADHYELDPRRWNDLDQLKIENAPNVYRLADDLESFLPDGFNLLQIDRGKFRLNPEARVATDWGKIAEHPKSEIAAFARERLRRRSSR